VKEGDDCLATLRPNFLPNTLGLLMGYWWAIPPLLSNFNSPQGEFRPHILLLVTTKLSPNGLLEGSTVKIAAKRTNIRNFFGVVSERRSNKQKDHSFSSLFRNISQFFYFIPLFLFDCSNNDYSLWIDSTRVGRPQLAR
jgi:hypothetical protein